MTYVKVRFTIGGTRESSPSWMADSEDESQLKRHAGSKTEQLDAPARMFDNNPLFRKFKRSLLYKVKPGNKREIAITESAGLYAAPVVSMVWVAPELDTASYYMGDLPDSFIIKRGKSVEVSWSDPESLCSEIDELVRGTHAKGIIHGDIRPRNMAYDERGNLCLVDWGSAHKMDGSVSVEEDYSWECEKACISPVRWRNVGSRVPDHILPSKEDDEYAMAMCMLAAWSGTWPNLDNFDGSDGPMAPDLRVVKDKTQREQISRIFERSGVGCNRRSRASTPSPRSLQAEDLDAAEGAAPRSEDGTPGTQAPTEDYDVDESHLLIEPSDARGSGSVLRKEPNNGPSLASDKRQASTHSQARIDTLDFAASYYPGSTNPHEPPHESIFTSSVPKYRPGKHGREVPGEQDVGKSNKRRKSSPPLRS
ncbi:hypothetical protein QBC46DRAFT_438375 [Diplogelasinospora grovesii]|uniref:Protein kinase domain-containing protein n=1 Tax=Diplogelasinospora grovesii TaxID=303347 RepID=A0AAN6N8A6_9PEZI|nr:hypothetical protein QBC46DRAFT_438375 [Diplogelasinospora grovesii]